MTAIILGVLAGVLLYAYHRERLKEVEQATREELEERLRQERRLHAKDLMRLLQEMAELQADMATEYQRGRADQRHEMQETGSFVKAFEGQRVHYALREVRK